MCASRGGRNEEREHNHRPRSTSPCASDARSVGPRPDSSSRDVKAKALRNNVTVASAAVLDARPACTEESSAAVSSILPSRVPLHTPKKTGKAAPRLQVVREQVPLQQRKAPSAPTSAASAAYLALGQAAAPRKTKVSIVRKTGVESVQAPCQASTGADVPVPEQQQDDASSPPPSPTTSTQGHLLDSSNVVSTVVETKAERDVLERSWRISEEERQQRTDSSREASTTTSSHANNSSRAWGGRKTPFVKPKRGGAVLYGRRVSSSKAKSAYKAAKETTKIKEDPEKKDPKEALVPAAGSEDLNITQGKVDRLKRRAGNLRSKTVGCVEPSSTRRVSLASQSVLEGFLYVLMVSFFGNMAAS